MKLSLWVYTTAVTVTAAASRVTFYFASNIFRAYLGNKPLPAFAAVMVEHPWWPLLVPIPFILASIMLCRGEAATTSRCLAFAAIATLAIVLLLGNTAIALVGPFGSFLLIRLN